MRELDSAVARFREDGVLSLLGATARYVATRLYDRLVTLPAFDSFLLRKSIHELERKQELEAGLYGILATAYGYRGYGIHRSIAPMQEPDEIAAFAECLGERSVETVVEIGSKNGGTLYIWSRFLSPEKVVSIDVDPSFPKRAQLFRQFSDAETRFLNARSQRKETVQAVADFLDEEGIDFLFIDGDHRYEAVREDFETYVPYVNDGGIVELHDIVEVDKAIMGVPRLWTETKDEYAHWEFIVPPDKDRGGIGVIEKCSD